MSFYGPLNGCLKYSCIRLDYFFIHLRVLIWSMFISYLGRRCIPNICLVGCSF
jgi:hypothetical protein